MPSVAGRPYHARRSFLSIACNPCRKPPKKVLDLEGLADDRPRRLVRGRESHGSAGVLAFERTSQTLRVYFSSRRIVFST